MKKIPKVFFRIFFNFFWSPVNRRVPKIVKGGPLGVFEHPFFCKIETCRERPKSAPYLRLKNSKRISKCQLFSFTVPA